ncbi:MAG: FliG C-terminal domain-containing protein [bacterium]
MADYPIEVQGEEIIGFSRDPKATCTVKRYDFKRPDKFSAEQLHTFRMINEMMARGFTETASSQIGRPVEVSVQEVDQLAYYEFIESVPGISCFAVIGLSRLRGSMILQLDGPLATLLADAACGQNAETLSLTAPERHFTEVESLVLESVLEDFMAPIRDAWHTTVELNPQIGGIESNPRNLQIVPPTEMILQATFAVQMGEAQTSIRLVVPYLTIEPIIHVLSPRYWYSSVLRGGDAPTLGPRAGDIPVQCELALAAGGVRPAELPAILEGEPLPLPSLSRGGAELRVGGVPVARLRVDARDLVGAAARTEAAGTGLDAAAAAAGEPSSPLTLDVDQGPAGSRTAVGGANGGAAEASMVLDHLHPVLKELRSEFRQLRIAIEEVQQNRDVSATSEATATSAEARSVAVDAPRDVARLISDERPPTVAFLLAPLEPQTAALVLSELPPELQGATARALTTLDGADLALHARLTTFLRRHIQTRRDSTVAGGPTAVAEILNHVPRSVEKAIMERFMTEDKPLFESIARLMFVFEDFVLVDADAIRKVADRVGPDELALALKGVSKEVTSHILGSLTDAQATAVEQAETALGRVRRSDVEAAQRDVIEELSRLEEAGEVVIARPDEMVE